MGTLSTPKVLENQCCLSSVWKLNLFFILIKTQLILQPKFPNFEFDTIRKWRIWNIIEAEVKIGIWNFFWNISKELQDFNNNGLSEINYSLLIRLTKFYSSSYKEITSKN